MNKKNGTNALVFKRVKPLFKTSFLLYSAAIGVFATSAVCGFGQTADSNDRLIDQYVQSLGKNTIVFDASNIKQYWIDPSVLSTNKNTINIHLSQRPSGVFESNALKLQLTNVNEAQSCKIEVLTESPDTTLWITNSKSKKVASTFKKDTFLEYEKSSLEFHLEDVPDFIFHVNFSNPKKDDVTIKKMVLSFSKNQTSSYLSSPGKLSITKDNVSTNASGIAASDNHSFTVTGDRVNILSGNKILVSDNTLTLSARIRNAGSSPVTVYAGYQPCTKDGKRINTRNSLYNGQNAILKVVSSKKGSNSVVVDSYPEWKAGCFLALNAKEDLSDFPNFTLSEGAITDVKKTGNGQATITFDKPFKEAIEEGTTVRIQSPNGSSYIYTNTKTLQPGEEVDFSSSIQKDDNCFEFSSKAFSKGVYYVIPVILIRYANSNPENKCQISNFTVSY